MRAVWVSALLLVAGCDGVFGLEHVHSQGDDDASTKDAQMDAVLIDADIDAPRIAGCPPSYGPIGNLAHSYRIETNYLSWLTAENGCEADRGNYQGYTHLVVFADDAERSAVNAAQGVTGQYVWIGLNDRNVNLTYRWVTDEDPAYPPSYAWAAGQPDTTPGVDCAEMIGNSDLQMLSCGALTKSVCECDDHPVDKSHF